MSHTIRNICCAILLLGAVALVASSQRTEQAAQQQQTLPAHEVVVNGHRITVEIADDEKERELGLSFRESLPQGHGMLFVFPTSQRLRFWMYGMKFPLDMIFIRDGHVVHVTSDVPVTTAGVPTVVWPTEEADGVLELNAGEAKELGIEVGTAIATD